MSNMVFKTDSYNVSHFSMYPPGMTEASGYAECRANSEFENLSFFGLQYIINKRLIQQDPSKFDLDYAEARWNKHGELLIDEDFATIRERANKDGFDDYYGII